MPDHPTKPAQVEKTDAERPLTLRPRIARPAGDSSQIREVGAAYGPFSPRLTFQLDLELSDQLRLAARAGNRSPAALAAELLAIGLDQKARRARARSALAVLTPRERQVAKLAVEGQTNHQIAHALMISPETVKSHVRNALNRLGLRSKTELRLLLHELEHGQ